MVQSNPWFAQCISPCLFTVRGTLSASRASFNNKSYCLAANANSLSGKFSAATLGVATFVSFFSPFSLQEKRTAKIQTKKPIFDFFIYTSLSLLFFDMQLFSNPTSTYKSTAFFPYYSLIHTRTT